jgi:hypothetical protein
MGRSGAARRRSRKRRAEGRPPRRPAASRAAAAAATPAPAPAARQGPARPGQRRDIERPQAPWHPVPLTEIAILAGLVSFIIGLAGGNNTPLIIGLVVLLIAVIEMTAREHFAGFRSHSMLLAGLIAIAVEAVLYEVGGATFAGPVALAVMLPIFAALFFLFRGRYRESREARSIGR